jgi:uncharacterized protein YegL
MDSQKYFAIRFINHDSKKTHAIISWNGSDTFDVNQLNKNSINCLTIMIDVSSSMKNPLEDDKQKSRISVVKEALLESFEVLQKLVSDGIKIALNIITFCEYATKMYPPDPNTYFKILDHADFSFLRDLVQNLYACGGTSISSAINMANLLIKHQEQFFNKNGNPSRRYTKIMCSDGDDTVFYAKSNTRLVKDFGQQVDVTIGVGSACDYCHDVLVGLSKGGDFLSAPDKKTFVEGFVSKIFSATTLVATNVNLCISPDLVVETTISVDQDVVKIGDWQSYRSIILTFVKKELAHVPLKLTFHLEKHNINFSEIIMVEFKESVETPLSRLLNIYQNCTSEMKAISENTFKNSEYISQSEDDQVVWLRTHLELQKKKLEEALKEIGDDQDARSIIETVQRTIDELNKLKKAQRSAEYMADLHSTIRTTSTGVNTNLRYTVSRNYTNVSAEPDMTCLICKNNRRQVVAYPCGHLTSCVGCMSIMRQLHMDCPVCRTKIEQLCEVMFPSLKDDPMMRCQKCKKNRIQTFNRPCNHATYCTECSKLKDLVCPICDKTVTKTCVFHRS